MKAKPEKPKNMSRNPNNNGSRLDRKTRTGRVVVELANELFIVLPFNADFDIQKLPDPNVIFVGLD